MLSSSSEDATGTGTHEAYQPDLAGYGIDAGGMDDMSEAVSYELPQAEELLSLRPLLVRSGTEPHLKDWQQRHERAQTVQCDRERTEELSLLAKEFSFMAQMYAEVICVERDLPVTEKTIKPATQLGGVVSRRGTCVRL